MPRGLNGARIDKALVDAKPSRNVNESLQSTRVEQSVPEEIRTIVFEESTLVRAKEHLTADMRSSARLFATAKSAARYLEPNSPTGLTGLPTHPAPRPALIYNYRQTLTRLAQINASSVYRQATENLIKQRLQIVEDTIPEGFDAYVERVKKQIEARPDAYGKLIGADGSFSYEALGEAKPIPWDGEITKKDAQAEGGNSLKDVEKKLAAAQADADVLTRAATDGELPTVDELETEPPLTAEQISSIETQIGAGLIEEVVQVAEGELHLVNEMLRSRPWEPLEEPAPPGQWEYFERGDRV